MHLQLASLLLLFAPFTVAAQLRIVQVNPTTDEVILQNFGANALDATGYRLCSEIRYGFISSATSTDTVTVLSGDLTSIPPGGRLRLTVPPNMTLDPTGGDLGLYQPLGPFSQDTAMLDFVQWVSSGNGRESVAVTKGIWATGTFVSGTAPYGFTGGATDFGVGFWINGTASRNAVTALPDLRIFPNPAEDVLFVSLPNGRIETTRLLDATGREVFAPHTAGAIELGALPAGLYSLIVETTAGTAVRRVVVR